MNNIPNERLRQLFDLVEKEDRHLLAVRVRLMPADTKIDLPWLTSLLEMDVGVDRLESFSAKFSRMQDTVIDKLLPQLLRSAGEIPYAAIDNLNKAERLGLIDSADAWLQMRKLRNRLVHEYIENPEDMLPALIRARDFTDDLHKAYVAMHAYAAERLGLD